MKLVQSHKLLSFLLLFFIFGLVGCESKKSNIKAGNYQYSLLDEIIQRGVIRVGTTGDFMPFSYYPKSDPDKLSGIDIVLARDLALALGVEVEFVETTWPSLVDDLLDKKYDIAMSGVTIKLDRQKKVLFSMPVTSSGKVAITRNENVHKFQTIADINQQGVKVIANPGGTNESFARANFPQSTIIVNEDNITIFQNIVNGKADLMVTDAVEALVQQKIHPELTAINPNTPFNFFEMGFMFNRDHTFKAFIDQWVNLKKKDGSYKLIFENVLNSIANDSFTK